MASPAPATLSAGSAARLACRGLDVTVNDHPLVTALDFEARGGQFVAVLGRNGVGKTLTLHTLAGLRAPATGSVWLDGRELGQWPGSARARRLALLPQTTEDPFPATVFETALIGRHPHLPFWQWEGPDDLARAQAALAAVGIADLGARSVLTLSGGERRRLAVATLLAQDAATCLLDEPTNHLDPQHRTEILELFRARADAGGLVIATLHDATLAARYADQVLLLHGGGRWCYGDVATTLTAANLSELYAVPVEEFDWRGRRIFISS
ncbi:MAG: ABC transporter ATP-binding protein [Gammaproteobacteria bacterium]|nr:MAG: ABC transporter ATP-binding protein [Gammaproteobacteria bacterium]